jgi:hypothetical protein
MWVRLTLTGMKMCRRLVMLDDEMLAALDRNVTPHKERGVDVDAPYVVWKHIYYLLHRQTFGPRGGKKSETSFNTLQRITRELNYMEHHPALYGVAMVEWQNDLLPVWKITPDAEGRSYTLVPTPGNQFVILQPVWDRNPQIGKVTRWMERPSGPGVLCREETHLRLQRQT